MGLVDYEPILSQPYLDGPLIPAHNITLLDNQDAILNSITSDSIENIN